MDAGTNSDFSLDQHQQIGFRNSGEVYLMHDKN
jgi:hypothetical protein